MPEATILEWLLQNGPHGILILIVVVLWRDNVGMRAKLIETLEEQSRKLDAVRQDLEPIAASMRAWRGGGASGG